MLAFFTDRFGIDPAVFAAYEFIVRGRNIWIVAKSVHLSTALALQPHTVGLRLARETNLGIKPTTYGLQVFGHYATKNRLEIPREEALRFLRGEVILRRFDVTPGFVVVWSEGLVVGCGLYKSSGILESLIPRKIRLDAPHSPEETA